jgi:hypothetical protein
MYVACLMSRPSTDARRMRSVGALALRSIRMKRMVRDELIRLPHKEGGGEEETCVDRDKQ